MLKLDSKLLKIVFQFVGKIHELQQSLWNSEEYKRIESVKHFQWAIQIFNGNYKDLKRKLNRHNDFDFNLKLWGSGLWNYQTEITRRLHNFSASIKTLIDVSRAFKKTFDNKEFLLEYSIKVEDLFSSPLSSFMQDLRRYIQHYRIPQVTTISKSHRDPPLREVKLIIAKDELLRFPGWTSKPKEFINNNPDGLNIDNVIDEYHQLANDFNKWFNKEVKLLLRQEYKFVASKKEEIRKYRVPLHAFNSLTLKDINLFESGLFPILKRSERSVLSKLNGMERAEKLVEILEARYKIFNNLSDKIINYYNSKEL